MLTARVELLKELFPVKALIRVGSLNTYELSEYVLLAAVPVTFIVPEEEQRRAIAELIAEQSHWNVACAVLSDAKGEREYFEASNPRESGLLQPEELSGIWRNITTVSSRRVTVSTLSDVTRELAFDRPMPNWLVIDCLPAVAVLQGFEASLDECDVIVARAVLDESASSEKSCALSALDDFLVHRGFRRLAVTEERHPALGAAFYGRNWRQLWLDLWERGRTAEVDAAERVNAAQRGLEQLRREGEVAKLELESTAQRAIAELTARLELQARDASACRVQVQEMSAAAEQRERSVAELQRRLDGLSAEHERLQSQLEQHAAERLRAIDALAKERENQALQTATIQRALEGATEARDAFEIDLQKVRMELAQANETVLAQTERIRSMEKERDECQERQLKLDREVLKAEAQLELIKDVVLRDKAF